MSFSNFANLVFQCCAIILLLAITVKFSVAEDAYIDRELYPKAYGYLTSDHLIYPVDVSDWPLKIDQRRQLLVDDYLLASTDQVKRQFHAVRKHPDNPIITKTRPWEDTSIIPTQIRHEQGKFRLWYTTRIRYTLPNGKSVRFPTLYAESEDGIHWTKPNLGLIEFEGSKENNFLIHGGSIAGLFHDPQSEPDLRYKALVWHEPEYVEKEGYYLYTSPDGLKWKGDLDHLIIPNLRDGYTVPQKGIGDTSFFRYDPILGKYVGDVKFVFPDENIGIMRCRGQTESDDLIHWTRPRFTIYPDEHDDTDAQIYSNISFPYESMWLGLLRVMVEKRAGYKQVEIQLSMSRDGQHWSRPSDRKVIIPFGDSKSWEPDYTAPVLSGPIPMGDELWIYYRGCRHKSRYETPPDTHFSYPTMEMGLGILRRDGFASMDASEETGTLVTRPLTYSGQTLHLNAEIEQDGWIKAGFVTAAGKPIKESSLIDCTPVTSGGTEIQVRWKQTDQVPDSSNEPRRLIIEMSNAKLYSFWID